MFIDASKAFDRLCHIELFNILSERNMCPLVIDVYFFTCMVTNNSRYDGITLYLICTK